MKFTRNGPPWLVMELKPNRKLFPDHLPSIFHGALVGAGSMWPACLMKVMHWNVAATGG